MKKKAAVGKHGVAGFPGSGDITCERMLASLSNGVIATDRDGRIVSMNPQAGEILKLNVNRVMGAYIPDVLPMAGLPAGKNDLRTVAAAVSTLIRRFNVREGLVRNDDRLSPALHRTLKDSGKTITEDELAYMIREYHRLRGWDDQGIPPVETTMTKVPK
jgi:PAS domain-containing protein